ncbi:hypothetical protein H072_5663 [Dactylellina haptotyla CBS 200.50]|uniref:Uncharacterized protein n=1 Tax=Dactylellina haptotyla (strain CBS 200.50) TaxID=1284197 RepID=S8ABX4_DACHA|nr:hypothetical protein H072_5663 [Dactylellina haptotyla CBS 200.50]
MSSISQLTSKLQSTKLAGKSASAVNGTATLDESPFTNLPYDIVTHHLVPQFASPPVLLEPADPVLQVEPTSLPLRRLAATSRYFRSLVSGQYQTYVQHQYPGIHADTIRQAYLASTPLEKVNWFSRAIESEKLWSRWYRHQFYISLVPLTDAPDWRQQGGSTQNNRNHNHRNPARRVPYAPCLDVTQTLGGVETLVIGQGPQLAVRVGEYTPWKVISRKGTVAGVDDIHGVHIYDEDTIVSTRSSGIEVTRNVTGRDGDNLRISQAVDLCTSGVKNPTGGVTSSCLDPSISDTRSFAVTTTSAAGDDHKLEIFTLSQGESRVMVSKTAAFESALPSKSWVSTFLTSNTIAAGHRTGVSLYQLSQSSLSEAINFPQPSSDYDRDLAVHSLTRLDAPFTASVLASGWSDGITRLLDTRTNAYVATYANPVSNESSPIYSLCHKSPLSNILLAGASVHYAVEMHDLRYAGNMVGQFSPYMYTPPAATGGDVKKADMVSDGCLLFFDQIRPRVRVSQPGQWGRVGGNTGSRAVYSLASAAAGSGKVYVGTENCLALMDFRQRVRGKRWGWGLSHAEKIMKKNAEKGAVYNVPMYWFDPEKQNSGPEAEGHANCPHGGRGRWYCGNGKEAFKVHYRNRGSGATRAVHDEGPISMGE